MKHRSVLIHESNFLYRLKIDEPEQKIILNGSVKCTKDITPKDNFLLKLTVTNNVKFDDNTQLNN